MIELDDLDASCIKREQACFDAYPREEFLGAWTITFSVNYTREKWREGEIKAFTFVFVILPAAFRRSLSKLYVNMTSSVQSESLEVQTL